MDYVLFAVLGLYFLKGFVKGFVSTLLSLISVFVVVVCSWKLMEFCYPFVYNFLQEPISKFITSILNTSIEGTFQNLAEFENVFMSTNFAMFTIIKNLLPDLNFEGSLTAGQILSPSLTLFACKAITFLVLFFMLNFAIKLLRFLINKFIKVCGLSLGNRFLGGILGLGKGVMVFVLIFFVLTVVSNIILNKSFNNFVNSGEISKLLYDWIIKFLI